MSSIAFPLGIAAGRYFCNRESETKQLLSNIHQCKHTVLISPRRYGKTSLAYRAINKSNLPSARIDLYMTTGAKDIARAIIAGVDSLLGQVSNQAETLLGLIKDYVKSLKPVFEAGNEGFKITLQATERSTSAADISEALQILDGVLKKKSLQAVLFIDEFQAIQRIAPHQGIEGAIRHVAQETRNFMVIFSGSHRHLLRHMFNDRSKPLYRLCDEIHLDRILEKDYFPFIEKFAYEKWGKTLPGNVIKRILAYCENHPYYFNAICEKLFTRDTLPSEAEVDKSWGNLATLKKKDVLGETRDLTIIHRKLLVAIAHGIDHELTGNKFLSRAELSSASVIRALGYLEENDFIEKETKRYRIIDPLLKTLIKQLSYF